VEKGKKIDKQLKDEKGEKNMLSLKKK